MKQWVPHCSELCVTAAHAATVSWCTTLLTSREPVSGVPTASTNTIRTTKFRNYKWYLKEMLKKSEAWPYTRQKMTYCPPKQLELHDRKPNIGMSLPLANFVLVRSPCLILTKFRLWLRIGFGISCLSIEQDFTATEQERAGIAATIKLQYKLRAKKQNLMSWIVSLTSVSNIFFSQESLLTSRSWKHRGTDPMASAKRLEGHQFLPMS